MRSTPPAIWATIIAAAFLAGCSHFPPDSPSATTSAQRTATEKMLQSAQQADQAAVALEAKNPGRPDLIEMQIAWSGKILGAQMSLHPTGPERKKALTDHLEEAKARAERIRKLPHGVTTDLVTAQAEYAVAEAEWLQAGEK